jgi:hypothetical protein
MVSFSWLASGLLTERFSQYAFVWRNAMTERFGHSDVIGLMRIRGLLIARAATWNGIASRKYHQKGCYSGINAISGVQVNVTATKG